MNVKGTEVERLRAAEDTCFSLMIAMHLGGDGLHLPWTGQHRTAAQIVEDAASASAAIGYRR